MIAHHDLNWHRDVMRFTCWLILPVSVSGDSQPLVDLLRQASRTLVRHQVVELDTGGDIAAMQARAAEISSRLAACHGVSLSSGISADFPRYPHLSHARGPCSRAGGQSTPMLMHCLNCWTGHGRRLSLGAIAQPSFDPLGRPAPSPLPQSASANFTAGSVQATLSSTPTGHLCGATRSRSSPCTRARSAPCDAVMRGGD